MGLLRSGYDFPKATKKDVLKPHDTIHPLIPVFKDVLKDRLPKCGILHAGSFESWSPAWMPQLPSKSADIVLALWLHWVLWMKMKTSVVLSIFLKLYLQHYGAGTTQEHQEWKETTNWDRHEKTGDFEDFWHDSSQPQSQSDPAKLQQDGHQSWPGVFGATQRANPNYLSKRGCQDCIPIGMFSVFHGEILWKHFEKLKIDTNCKAQWNIKNQ